MPTIFPEDSPLDSALIEKLVLVSSINCTGMPILEALQDFRHGSYMAIRPRCETGREMIAGP